MYICQIVDGVYKSASSTEELFCGNNAPKNIPTSNTLFLVFVTDGSTHDKGFLANYSFIDGKFSLQ